MGNVLSKEKQQQVLALGQLGWPLRRIEEATGVRRETASGYLKKAGIPVRPPGKWGHGEPAKPAKEAITDSGAKPAKETITDSGAKPAKETITDLPPPRPGRSPQASACEEYRAFIEDAVGRGRNAMAIWQDLVEDHEFGAQYASVQRFVRKLRGSQVIDAHPVILTEPGEEAQIDYGEGPMVRHPETGKYRRTRLFILTLGYSRKAVRLLVWKSSTKIWCELIEQAFRRLGGAPKILVLDNLREAVIKPDIYDPTLNPLFADLLKHYGVVGLPCRVRHPNRKGKVESSIGHTKRTPLGGMRFESLEEAQAYLDRWDSRWADTRIPGTTKRQVAAMFAEEKPALAPLPLEPFRYYEFGKRTVHLDGAVEVARAYYQAPPGWIGKEVHVQWDSLRVRLIDLKTGELLREHTRKPPGHHSRPRRDQPKRTPPTTRTLLERGRRAGKHVGMLCQRIHDTEGEAGVRRILGVQSLVKKHGSGLVDDACAAALELGVPTYRFVRRYLDRKKAAPLSLRQVDPLIRQLTQYRDLIDDLTQGDES
jgi:transposase